MTSKVLLFTSPTCNPCKALKAYLATNSHDADEINIESPAGHQQSRMYRVRSLPTLVRVDDQGGLIESVVGFNVPSVKQFFS